MTPSPTPTQIAEWREKFLLKDPSIFYRTRSDMFDVTKHEEKWQGYLRARTEQATEIAELKAKVAELNRRTSSLIQFGNSPEKHDQLMSLLAKGYKVQYTPKD